MSKSVVALIENRTGSSHGVYYANQYRGRRAVYCERLDGTKTQSDNVDLPCVEIFYLKDENLTLARLL